MGITFIGTMALLAGAIVFLVLHWFNTFELLRLAYFIGALIFWVTIYLLIKYGAAWQLWAASAIILLGILAILVYTGIVLLKTHTQKRKKL